MTGYIHTWWTSNYSLESKSAKVLAVPGIGSSRKRNSWRANAQCNRRLFFVFADCRKVRGLWSVCKVNCLPVKKRENFSHAHTIARHSLSTVEYFCCGVENFLLANWTGWRRSSFLCRSTAPIPFELASVRRTKSSDNDGSNKTGKELKIDWIFSTADWHSDVQMICRLQFPFVRSVRGAVKDAKFGTYLL